MKSEEWVQRREGSGAGKIEEEVLELGELEEEAQMRQEKRIFRILFRT